MGHSSILRTTSVRHHRGFLRQALTNKAKVSIQDEDQDYPKSHPPLWYNINLPITPPRRKEICQKCSRPIIQQGHQVKGISNERNEYAKKGDCRSKQIHESFARDDQPDPS